MEDRRRSFWINAKSSTTRAEAHAGTTERQLGDDAEAPFAEG
jgi:hypothetical protein